MRDSPSYGHTYGHENFALFKKMDSALTLSQDGGQVAQHFFAVAHKRGSVVSGETETDTSRSGDPVMRRHVRRTDGEVVPR